MKISLGDSRPDTDTVHNNQHLGREGQGLSAVLLSRVHRNNDGNVM